MFLYNTSNLLILTLEKIIFYDDRNVQGRFHECDNDSSDWYTCFRRCSSSRVEGGFWVIYESPSYRGYQYVLAGHRRHHQVLSHWLQHILIPKRQNRLIVNDKTTYTAAGKYQRQAYR
ncbi:gamma-crystallin S-like [Siniperca chuatsi]|uniref:gamma-crystallin S-like n=1 Tax=Siniperca chuatsi TaxID=119488 RepID=UPI001CE1E013|nr:gamma-crystallin S-like [Siniperca chuatsi]